MYMQLQTLLQHYYPKDGNEQKFKQQMIEFINKYTNTCFERSLEVGHFTGSSWLLNKNKNKALLMHHTKLDKWFQLGGHCDGDPDVLGVSIKESQEESGIVNIEPISNEIFDIDIHLIPENKYNKAHYHYDVRFLLYVTSDEEIVQNRESKELRWIDKDPKNLPTNTPSIIRMFNKWISMEL